MKVCIYGAGAVGAWLGARLTKTDADVTLVARGPHLDAMRTNGLQVEADGESEVIKVNAVGDTTALPEQDLVIITLKAHSIPPAIPAILPLLGDHTTIVTAVNGIPWWYLYRNVLGIEEKPIDSVDPGGVLWNSIGPERAVGCVVYPAAELYQPGRLRHIEGERFSFGEPSGEPSERVDRLCSLIDDAGLESRQRKDLRNEIWLKLWGNVAFNPLSVLTNSTLENMVDDAGVNAVAAAMMQECQKVGEALGIRFRVSLARRIAAAGRVGAHRTSMLQDYDQGRQLETGALLDAVIELADFVEVQTPTIELIYSLLKLRVRERDLAAQV